LFDIVEKYRHGNYSSAANKTSYKEFNPFLRTLEKMGTEINLQFDQLQTAEEKYRNLIENSPDLRFRADIDGNMMFVSQSIYKLTGYSVHEMLAMNLNQDILTDPEQRDSFLNLLKKNDSVDNFETKLNRKDGSSWWASTNAHYFRDRENMIGGIEGVTRDITELKEAQNNKERLEVQLGQSQKMEAIGTLAGGIAHDFNNILSGIFGYTQLATIHINHPEKATPYLNNILQGARKAADLVQQILTFSRKSEQEKVPLNLSLIVKEALKLLRSSIPATINIKETFESDAVVIADPIKIHQIVMNLCTNAFHAMQEEGGLLTVVLDETTQPETHTPGKENQTQSGYVRLGIYDTGCGIDKAILDKIFEPYYTTKDKDKGTGLGLAVVLGIVEEHKGIIHVESETGQGTEFEIFLPVTDKNADTMIRKKDIITDLNGNETIAVIDDEESILSATKIFLEEYGYKVMTYTNGVQALEEFRHQPDQFDLVITDMTMPKLTGDRLAVQILEINPQIPVILCSGYNNRITRQEAREMGIRHYIEKPVVLNDLAALIRQNLDLVNKPGQS